MSKPHYDDNMEQPEYQWAEEFMEGMFSLAVALISLFCTVICAIFTNLFSEKGQDPPSETE